MSLSGTGELYMGFTQSEIKLLIIMITHILWFKR